jgi:cysteine desulfurase
MNTIYLDNNATTRPAPEVVTAMTEALAERWHNPSSAHRPGQAARQAVELARETIARVLGCSDREIIFTSGGTEADNLAILGTLEKLPDRNVIVTSPTEHEAIRETAERAEHDGAEIVWLPIDSNGVVDCDALEDLLKKRADDIALVTIMWGNNEVGTIQPIDTLGALCREHGVRFHTDAVQWVGKEPTNLADAPVDLLSFSGHKFHGPKGAGGLYVRRGVRLGVRSIGGAQERNRRGGTENVPGLLGLAAAAQRAHDWLASDEPQRMKAMRDRFEREVASRIDGATVNGAGADRVWNTANIAFPKLEAEAILLLLSERGVCASAGAACASGSLDPSPILMAMGIDPIVAHGAVRFSLSRDTTDVEIDAALDIIEQVIDRLRGSSSAL